MSLASVAGVLAGIIGFSAFIPYILGMLKKKTTPNRATWVVWAILGIIIAASYYSSGARDTIWAPVAYAIGITIVAFLSIWYGEGGWTIFDIACLLGCAAGFILWALTNNPLVALYFTIIVDAIGSFPTIKKAYERPESEDQKAWLLFLLANTVNLFAITSWTLSVVSYPIYVMILNIIMNVLILRKR